MVREVNTGAGAASSPVRRGWKPGDRWPLLVMVHGCQTTAYQQMEANLYNPLADEKHFVVAYPDTDPLENGQPDVTARCWQFPKPAARRPHA